MKYVCVIFFFISAVCVLSTTGLPISEIKTETDLKPNQGVVVLTADVEGDQSGAQGGFVRAEYNQLWGAKDDIHVETLAKLQKNFGKKPSDSVGGIVKLSYPIKF